MEIEDRNMNWELIDDIKNAETLQVEGSAVTKKDHKPVDPVLDGLVESLKKDSEGKNLSVISKAVEEGNAEQLDLLLQAGVSPDTKDATGISPYQRAYQGKKDDICAKLIDAGADHKNTDLDGNNLVVKAVQDNKTKVVISWIKAGASIKTRESNGMRSVIYIAAENSNWEVL